LDVNLPYKNPSNLVVPFDKLFDATIENKRFHEHKEKIYVYADFLPSGKHNSCLVYNTSKIPNKDIFNFVTVVRPREELIPISKFIIVNF